MGKINSILSRAYSVGEVTRKELRNSEVCTLEEGWAE